MKIIQDDNFADIMKDEVEPYLYAHCRECYNLIWQDKPYNLIGEDLTGSIPYVTRHRFDLFHMSEKEIKEMKDRYLIWQENHFMCDLQKDDTEHHWNYGIE